MPRVRRWESGRTDSPSSRARERFIIEFRPLMLQCAINPIDDVLAISAFVLGNTLLLDLVYQALENGAAVVGQ